MTQTKNVQHASTKDMLNALRNDAVSIESATVAKPGWVMMVNGEPLTTRNHEPLLILKMASGEKRIIIGGDVEVVLNSGILQRADVPIKQAQTRCQSQYAQPHTSRGGHVVSYNFDRDAAWEKVKDRKAVYLDMMVWIAMADGKPDGQTIKDKLREGVRSGKVFCPLSQTLLWELHKQDYSKMRTGALMEELSLNACFSRKQDVFTWEVQQLARRSAHQEILPSSRKMLFTSIIGHVAGDMTLTYPVNATEEQTQGISRLICRHLDAMGLTEFLKLAEHDKEIANHIKKMAPPPYQKQAKFFRERAKGDRGKVWRAEELAVSNAYIKPAMDSLTHELFFALAQFLDGVPKDKNESKLYALIAECTAIHNHLEAMTRNSEDHNRKDRVNDFFDLEMLTVPLAYADVLVTLDGWVRERFLKPGDFLKRSKCRFFAAYPELESWLDTL